MTTAFQKVIIPSSAASHKTLSLEGTVSLLISAYVRLREQGQQEPEDVIVGKVNVITYDRIENTVHIVPVNNVSPPNGTTLMNNLNEIYGQAVAGWTVIIEEPFTIDPSAFTDFDAESGDLAAYNQKQRQFNRAYRDFATDYNDDHYYIFLIPGNVSVRKGFMPFKRWFGYIFVNNLQNDLEKAIAHELGHGAFRLRHTFDQFPLTENATQNLMDKGSGKELKKYQWDLVHDPESMIGWVQDDEESALGANPEVEIARLLLSVDGTGFLYCKKCEQQQTISLRPEENFKYTTVINGQFYNCIIGHVDPANLELAYNIQSTDQTSLQQHPIASHLSPNQNQFLLIGKSDGSIVPCQSTATFPSDFCSQGRIEMSESLENQILEEILACVSPGALTPTQIEALLRSLRSNARSNQEFEFSQGDAVYSINEQNQLERKITPLPDADVNAGNWTQGPEMLMRLGVGEDGVLGFNAIGIRKNLQLATGKSASLPIIAGMMLTKSNALLRQYQINEIGLSPAAVGVTMDSELFPDGKKINVDENGSFFKIICEAAGITVSFLKTAEVERPVYHETSPNPTIQLPPVLTGTVESVGMVVTDLTSTVSVVFDFVVDGEARTNAINGFSQIKDQIADNPTSLFPILYEVALEEFTGANSDQYGELTADATDSGRRGHLITKTGVRTTTSVFTSGQFLAKLPMMAAAVSQKMARGKLLLKFTNINNLAAELVQQFRTKLNSLPDKGAQFLEDFKDATNDVLEKFVRNANLIDAWKVLGDHPILRKNTWNLENIKKWIDEGIESEKIRLGIERSDSKQNLIDELGTAKSRVHAQVLIKDYDNIPGVARGRYSPNASVLSDKLPAPPEWHLDFDLPTQQIRNFTGKIEPFELNPGQKIYRVSHANGASGPYWTMSKPDNLGDVIGGTAVLPEWNNFSHVHEYTVPEAVTIKCWKGKTARQPVSYLPDGTASPSNYHLPGGDEQLFIGFIDRQDINFQATVNSLIASW